MKCGTCGGALDLSMGACPGCGAEVELGRLTGILGIVCRGCDAYNEPGAKACVACGAPLRLQGEPPEPPAAPAPPPPAPPVAHVPARDPSPAPVVPLAALAARDDAPGPGGGPVVRSFQKGSGPATRFIPAAAFRPAVAEAPLHTPVPGATRCPRCGAAAGAGAFCAQCGQALAQRGTQILARAPEATALVPGRARLVVEGGATVTLEGEQVAAGRGPGPLSFPDDPCLAPLHATFVFRAGTLHLRDEGAPGGTFLRLRGLSVTLRPGELFAVGDRLLRFAGALPPPPEPPADGTRRLGAPRPAGASAVLEERLQGGATGRVFVRGGPSVTIGRAGCAVNLGEDPRLSQAHAELLLERDGTARLRDLGSAAGTFAQLPPHAERELRDGDVVRIGGQVLRVASS